MAGDQEWKGHFQGHNRRSQQKECGASWSRHQLWNPRPNHPPTVLNVKEKEPQSRCSLLPSHTSSWRSRRPVHMPKPHGGVSMCAQTHRPQREDFPAAAAPQTAGAASSPSDRYHLLAQLTPNKHGSTHPRIFSHMLCMCFLFFYHHLNILFSPACFTVRI